RENSIAAAPILSVQSGSDKAGDQGPLPAMAVATGCRPTARLGHPTQGPIGPHRIVDRSGHLGAPRHSSLVGRPLEPETSRIAFSGQNTALTSKATIRPERCYL